MVFNDKNKCIRMSASEHRDLNYLWGISKTSKDFEEKIYYYLNEKNKNVNQTMINSVFNIIVCDCKYCKIEEA